MADALGLVSLPATAPTITPPGAADLAPGDPALVQLASFAATVLQYDCGAAWTQLDSGKPDVVGGVDGTRDGTTVVRRCLFSDPREGYFTGNDLPALFVYRGATSTMQWHSEDVQRRREQVLVTWVAPLAEAEPDIRERSPFLNTIRASLHVALTQRRHPAWVRDDEAADPDGLKTSFVTSTSTATITSFDGALAGEDLETARRITITTAAAPGVYNTTDAITITGTLANGLSHTESVYLTDAAGDETVTTVFPFVAVTSVALPAMATTGGGIEIGYAASSAASKGSLIQRACRFREMRLTRAQRLRLEVQRLADGERDTFLAVEVTIDVAEDSDIDAALRGHAPWDVEAHGTEAHPGAERFEFIIED